MMEKMQAKMMKRYQLFGWLGFIVVVIAFLFSLQAAGANSTFFSVDKAAREAAGAGSTVVAANVLRHSIATWVPAFKFLGLGLMLGAITMALGVIATTLRGLGGDVMGKWPQQFNPGVPPKPRTAKIFPMLMMMGWMVLIAGLVVALLLNGTVTSYWAHSIATELNPAQPGSLLLNQLAAIKGTMPWISLLRFMGMGLVFTAITVALTVIIRTLQHQEQTLRDFIAARTG